MQAQSVEDLRKLRAGSHLHNSPHGFGTGMFAKGAAMFPQYSAPSQYGKNQQNPLGMNLSSSSLGASARASPNLAAQSYPSGGVPVNNNLPTAYLYNGQIVWAGNQYGQQATSQGQSGTSPTNGNFNASGSNLFSNYSYPGYPQYPLDNSPSWATSRVPSSELPTLVTPRRDSSSSNDNDAPGTPFTQYTGYGDMRPGVAVVDNSPQSMYWSTPSPSQARFGNLVHGNFGKHHVPSPIPLSLQMLCQQDPPIPRAVPAPYSPPKALDKALENPHGTTNVYVRGLQPNTTDEMLVTLASRFGDIASSKSIIDHNTGRCKGFGFVKYHNFKDAESCIRGFHWCGYETSFARESFYSQLKKLSDECNCNLYVSNLPKDMNEAELRDVFLPYETESTRILRQPDGSGRGVGFARFKTKEVCEGVIKNFNNKAIQKGDSEEYNVQIRYADTPEQKALKAQTTAARQYRTAEYESQTQSPVRVQSSQYAARAAGFNGGAPGFDDDFGEYMNLNGGGHIAGDGNGHLSSNSTQTVVNLKAPNAKANANDANEAGMEGEENTVTMGSLDKGPAMIKNDVSE